MSKMRLFKFCTLAHETPWYGVYLSYHAAEQARRRWIQESYKYNHSYQERYLTNLKVMEMTWRETQKFRLDEGVWEEPVWRNTLPPIEDHFAHVSEEDPEQIAFTASPEHGERDRQTRMKPGRYLQRYYPDLTPKKIAFFAEWWRRGSRPTGELSTTLHFAKTGDEFYEVYDEGPSSCMKGMDAVRVYAAGDLQLAYTVRECDDRIITRALCWPEKKIFARIYPVYHHEYDTNGFANADESQAAAGDLQNRLKAFGWESVYEVGAEALDGARIEKVRISDGCYRMPYLDHGGVDDAGEYFVLKANSPQNSGGGTNGEMEWEEEDDRVQCYYCEDMYDEDDTMTLRRGPNSSRWFVVCDDCRSSHSFYCDGSNEDYYSPGLDQAVTLADGRTVHEHWADDYCWTSDFDEERYVTDTTPPVELYDGRQWTQDQVDEDAFTCELNGWVVPNDEWLTAAEQAGIPAPEAATDTQQPEIQEAA